MELSRKQELALIKIGINKVLDDLVGTKPVASKPKPQGRPWTETQRRKFKRSMKKVWKAKQAKKNGKA